MNYVEFHLGDYMRDTAHLSMLEDAAYRRLLDSYYVRERPLPRGLQECFMLARATSKKERNAVSYVLTEFFRLDDDGYHQRRADAEIERYHEKRRKAKASAEVRWKPCERNANALPTQCEGNALQTPESNLQSPVTKKEEREPASRATRLPEDFGLNPERRRFCEKEGLDPERTMDAFRDHWRAANGENARKHDWDAVFRNWCRRECEFSKTSKPKPPNNAAAWAEAKSRAHAIGFRDPWPQESVSVYLTAIKLEENLPPKRVVDLSKVLKRVPS